MPLVAWQEKVQRVCISHITDGGELSSIMFGGAVGGEIKYDYCPKKVFLSICFYCIKHNDFTVSAQSSVDCHELTSLNFDYEALTKAIDQLCYIKIQHNIIDFSTRLKEKNPTISIVIPRRLILGSIVLGQNFDISKLVCCQENWTVHTNLSRKQRNFKSPALGFSVDSIFETELFKNDDITIITWFPWRGFPQTQIQNHRLLLRHSITWPIKTNKNRRKFGSELY